MRTVKTFRKLGQDEEGHSTSFETHKYPGDLGTGQLALRGLDVEEAGEGRRQGLFKFQPPVTKGVPSCGYAEQHPVQCPAQLSCLLWASPVLGR